jgi:hypothetical protein
MIQRQPVATWQPEVAGDRAVGENERPYWDATSDVEESWITPLV